MEKIRVGLIGVGGIARLHQLGYRDNPHAELYAICDVDEGLLRQRAADWGVRKSYADYRQLLADPAVDAVEVITPHHLHEAMGVAALAAGKHVSMQKPMAVTVGECEALIAAARRAGTLFRVFENFRYYPPLVRGEGAAGLGGHRRAALHPDQGGPGVDGRGREDPVQPVGLAVRPGAERRRAGHPGLRLPPLLRRHVAAGGRREALLLDHVPAEFGPSWRSGPCRWCAAWTTWPGPPGRRGRRGRGRSPRPVDEEGAGPGRLAARQPRGGYLEVPGRGEVRLVRGHHLLRQSRSGRSTRRRTSGSS